MPSTKHIAAATAAEKAPVGRKADAGPRAARPGERPVGRERVAQAQRARMIAAMIGLAAEQGAAEATVSGVVSRSGVSRRTFYEAFTDAQDCLLAAIDAALATARSYVLERYDPGRPWRARIRAALEALLCFLDDEPAMGRLLVVESFRAGPVVLARRRQLLATLAAAVDEGRGVARSGSIPIPLAAEGAVGAVLAVLHARLLDGSREPLIELANPLMSMIVLPYLGPAAARAELERPAGERVRPQTLRTAQEPLKDIHMRLTYRTMRVLAAIAAHPCSSNRQIGQAAGIADQGQISKLLARLGRLGLIVNDGVDHPRGTANVWRLTPRGAEVEQATSGWPEAPSPDRGGRRRAATDR